MCSSIISRSRIEGRFSRHGLPAGDSEAPVRVCASVAWRAASAATRFALAFSPLLSARGRFLAAWCALLGRHVPSTSMRDQPSEVRTERTSVPCLRYVE
eukprot:CAMPEP_0202851332 /NCGR_PEP_ID=MMETSP1389-20130828/86057_1 /ASSEMBLY_ACC=CAM_ASM_000865 /TAXON_ID=302021 /ORGANISM="Rhodomonas sp., Strain CCMP768" /LENGTH=98 /DNA_ID=CAMNT_0049529625 /DNA_START=1 /DNA_END=297 /DNA_ORIENTATION=+